MSNVSVALTTKTPHYTLSERVPEEASCPHRSVLLKMNETVALRVPSIILAELPFLLAELYLVPT